MIDGALIGFGVVASNGHLPAYHASAELRIIAVVDPRPERRAAAETLIPGITAVRSIEDLPAAVQFVDVCTPPSLHADSVLAALDRGCHVLCEKPLVLSSDDARRIRTRAVEQQLAVVPVHNWKYAPILRRATTLLQTGCIGPLQRVEIVTTRTHAAVPVDAGYNWRTNRTIAGGGILMDHGWHAVALALDWFSETPIAVEADLRRSTISDAEHEAAVTIQFPSGAADIFLTWRGQSRRNRITLVGERGTIIADDDVLRVSGAEPLTAHITPGLSAGSHHADWFTAMLPDVIQCFRDPAQSRPLFDRAALCLSIIEQAYAGSAASAS